VCGGGGASGHGNITIAAFTDVGIHADSTLSIEVRPYTKTVGFRIESGQVIVTWQGDQDMLAAIADMCVAAARVLRGEVPPHVPPDDSDDPPAPSIPS